MKLLLKVIRAVILIYVIFPFYWAIVSSLRSGPDLFSTTLFPTRATFQNYYSIFLAQPFGLNILNSVVVATITVFISLFLGFSTSYVLSRKSFFGRKMILYSFLLVSIFPQITILSGLFQVIRTLGLYNHKGGLILSYMIFSLPFSIWTLAAFMKSVPKEIEESALMDGAGPWTIMSRVFFPIMISPVVATSLLVFVLAWNEFLFALTFTASDTSRTVPVAIALMSGGSEHELPWGNIMAASVVVTLPIILLVIVFQKKFISGLTSGALKG
jgi:trehalose/maltose transport system permease protein